MTTTATCIVPHDQGKASVDIKRLLPLVSGEPGVEPDLNVAGTIALHLLGTLPGI